jgi:chromatin assembly factor 1 subunit B
MPALPAIRTPPSLSAWAHVKLYGDGSFTNFFRRLTFSPDGGLLLTPAGQFEDPSVIPGLTSRSSGESEAPARGRKSRPSINTSDIVDPTSVSSVYIYSRANFARPPIAQLPGHKKASVAVRFSPILYELRQGVIGPDSTNEIKTAVLDNDKGGEIDVDLVRTQRAIGSGSVPPPPAQPALGTIAAPTPRPTIHMASPALSPTDLRQPPTPTQSKPPTPSPATGSVFALQYRMLFAVVTMDTVSIYDTQQAGPICMLTKLHYDEFTDMTW